MKRVIRIWGDITPEMSLEVAEKLQSFANQDATAPIYLAIDTDGGLIYPTQKIMEAIKKCPAPVHGLVTGNAFSAGFLILQCCRMRLSLPGGRFLFHPPRYTAEDISRITTFPAEQDFVDDESEEYHQMVSLVTERTGNTQEVIRALGKGETILGFQEALAIGLIDEVATFPLQNPE